MANLFKTFQEKIDEHNQIERLMAQSINLNYDLVARSTKALSESRELLARVTKELMRR